jgi:hypothetical protein
MDMLYCKNWPCDIVIKYSLNKFGLRAGQGTEVTLHFGGRQLLLLNDEAWRCHPYTQGTGFFFM